MFTHHRARGFVLEKINQGESDQLFVVYTDKFGKLEILGKSIRKIKSKLRSGIDLFYLSEVEYIQGKTYKTLTDAILINDFKNIRKDLEKISLAEKISTTLNDLAGGQESDEKIWRLLIGTLGKINAADNVKELKSKIYYYFFWNLVSILGYKPELYNCSLCQKKISSQDMRFSFTEGGLICGKCFKKDKTAKFISPDAVKIIRIMIKKEWAVLKRIKIETEAPSFLKTASDSYFLKLLEKNN